MVQFNINTSTMLKLLSSIQPLFSSAKCIITIIHCPVHPWSEIYLNTHQNKLFNNPNMYLDNIACVAYNVAFQLKHKFAFTYFSIK